MNLSNVKTEALLDELARRARPSLDMVSTPDLVDELALRDGVEYCFVDPCERARVVVEGPAMIITVFD